MTDARENGAILEVRGLTVHYPLRTGVMQRVTGVVRAVEDVSLRLPRGKTLGLVGESGCGKSTLARAVLRLAPAASGEVVFEGENLFEMNARRLRAVRRRLQIVFQDPLNSLNPRMRVETLVGEAVTVHGIARGRERRSHLLRILERVGLEAAHLDRYPHELSGGQRQRVGIARALALEPQVVVCDEPVSALDVSVQAQILNLLADLQVEMGLSYLFIAHNLAVVKHFCDEVAVMYLGRIVEQGSAEAIYANPRHPYTQALLSAVPEPDPTTRRERIVLAGELPSPINPPSGCPFHPRCPIAVERCRVERPVLAVHDGCLTGQMVACHRAGETGVLRAQAGAAQVPSQ